MSSTRSPNHALALYQLTLQALQRQDEAAALSFCRKALLHAGGHGPLRNNLALVLKRLHCFADSEAALRDLVADHPGDSDAWSNLGEVCKAQGKLNEAAGALRCALACTASHRSVHDNLLLLLQYLPQISRVELAQEHRRYGEHFPPQPAAAHRNSPDPERPLRIGYLSPDIRRHAAARFIEPLLRGRDRRNFQVLLYGQLQDLDEVSQRLIGLADGWCCTVGLSSQQLAQRIRLDRIDLLVDLAGHTAGNRLDVLPLRPAPLLLTTLGYPDSTGLCGLDGRITDALLDPAGEELFSSEPLLRLSGSFCCFQPPAESPALRDPPCLSTGATLRLLSPHQLFKLNEPLLRLWAQIMQQLPTAELVLLRSSLTAANQTALSQRLQHCGIDPARVRMQRPLRDDRAYLEAIASCDLMLDAWPHNGHTTSCEALWMGLPVVTLLGDRPCGRLAASVLSALGRSDWIAPSDQAYVDTVVRLARDPAGLQAARRSLRGQMAATVADASAHMARLEAQYRQLWRQRCREGQQEFAGDGPSMTALSEPMQNAAVLAAKQELLIISASRRPAEDVERSTLLGRSLARPVHRGYRQQITSSNTTALGAIYNSAIEQADHDSILVFCHDDLWLGDDSLIEPLLEAFEFYDVIGVAGSSVSVPGQSVWWCQPNGRRWGPGVLVGAIHHGTPESNRLSQYGPSPAQACLLDGVFLAARALVLKQAGLRFDPAFAFHFYDLDFCRSALLAGLRLGVWPLPLIHTSGGNTNSIDWKVTLNQYRSKWDPHLAPPGRSPGAHSLSSPSSTTTVTTRPPALKSPSLSQDPYSSGPAGTSPAEFKPVATGSGAERPSVAVSYEHTNGLAALLERLDLSVLLSTYQAGRLVSLGCHGGELRVGFSRFDQAMGLCRTPTGLAVGSRDGIWSLPASREIAPRITPEGEHDIAFLARSCHHSGPLMGHDLAWCGNRLWLVNTLFNGLVTIEDSWSFVPQWQPPFISGWELGDRCHLNGLAINEDGSAPAYVTALGETDTENGWREHKASGGCLIHVPSGETVLRDLSMPHSPRLYNGALYLLDSGHGTLIRVDPLTGERSTVAVLPGFTRGLDCFAGHAFVGLSQIRETAVFGGLPLQNTGEDLRCGLAVVNLSSGAIDGFLLFISGIKEVFAISVLPGWRNPALIGPDISTDDSQAVWLVPPPAMQILH